MSIKYCIMTESKIDELSVGIQSFLLIILINLHLAVLILTLAECFGDNSRLCAHVSLSVLLSVFDSFSQTWPSTPGQKNMWWVEYFSTEMIWSDFTFRFLFFCNIVCLYSISGWSRFFKVSFFIIFIFIQNWNLGQWDSVFKKLILLFHLY